MEQSETKRKINVVIVDDESDSVELIAFFLNQMPEVQIVGKFEGAVHAMRGIKNFTEKPHIIFTDINMPGIDGIEMCRRIRHFLPDVEFVFITAYNEYAPETRELKPIGFLQKPIESAELHHCIRLFIAKLL